MKKEKLKILCFHTWTCPRSYKINKALKNSGHEIKTIIIRKNEEKKENNPFIGFNYGINVKYLLCKDDKIEILKNIKKEVESFEPDIITSFDDKLTARINEISKKRVVHIVNDIYSLSQKVKKEKAIKKKIFHIKLILSHLTKNPRKGIKEIKKGIKINFEKIIKKKNDPQIQSEKSAYEKSELVIFPSEGMKSYAKQKYNMKKTSVVLNAVLKKDAPERTKKKISQGTKKIHLIQMGRLPKNLESFVKKLPEEIKVHIYNYSKEKIGGKNLVYHDPLPYKKLLEESTKYDAGLFVGYPKTLHFHVALGNKFFDYAVAGIPIISGDYLETKKFINKFKTGFIIKRPTEIKKLPLRNFKVRKKKEFFIEHYLSRVEKEMKKLIEK